jgi:two-component system NarL family response regulator/two-component system nitrate/nitrite response regulator NarL
MTSRVIIADDHPVLLWGLKDLLLSDNRIELIEATSSGARALALVRSEKPDIAVLDVTMPDVGGMAILQAVYDNRWPVRVVFLSASLTGKQIAAAIGLGVYGLLLKDYAATSLLDCLDQVMQGQKWLPDDLIDKARREAAISDQPHLDCLTPRELKIAELVCRGISNKAIAQQVGSSEGTVSIHLQNIYRKLGISSRTMLATLYIQHQSARGN